LARDLAILFGLAAILLLAGLGTMALTDRDEGANAAAAREMLEQGSWITPTLNYAPRFAKPAFAYWLMAGAYALVGVGELGARLPSAVAATALVLIQYAFARWAFGGPVGFRAALVLLLGVEYVAIGRMALTDALLALWTTSAVFAFFRAHHGAPPRGGWYAVMYTALALAMLIKGPVGVLVPGLAVGTYLAIAGGASRVWREARPGWGLLLFLALAGPWYAAMFWVHGTSYLARARAETLGRVLRTVTGPGGTALFYVPVILVGLFPWSALLPGALAAALRHARARAAADRRGATQVFAAAWLVSGLVFFALAQSRLPHYVAPIFPAAALLVAAGWPAVVPGLARILLAALGTLLGGSLVGAWLMGGTLTRLLAPAYPADTAARLPPTVLAMAGLACAAAGCAVIRDGARLFRALAVVTALLLVVGAHLVLPAFSAAYVSPAGVLARRAGREARPCDRVAVYGPYRPSLTFYAQRAVTFAGARDPRPLAEAAASRPGRLFVVTPRALRGALPPEVAGLPEVESRGGYLLLADPATGEPCR
jgi:4-amino-4-deoxy-L-arabinose transferase-like glycosyltransferase